MGVGEVLLREAMGAEKHDLHLRVGAHVSERRQEEPEAAPLFVAQHGDHPHRAGLGAVAAGIEDLRVAAHRDDRGAVSVTLRDEVGEPGRDRGHLRHQVVGLRDGLDRIATEPALVVLQEVGGLHPRPAGGGECHQRRGLVGGGDEDAGLRELVGEALRRQAQRGEEKLQVNLARGLLEQHDAGVEALEDERVGELEDVGHATEDAHHRQHEEDVERLRCQLACPRAGRRVAERAELVAAVELRHLGLVAVPPARHQQLAVPGEARPGVGEARPLAVVDEDVVGDDAAPAGGAGAEMEVGLLAVAAVERLVEDAEGGDELALHQQAEADHGGDVGIEAGGTPRHRAREGEDVLAGRDLHRQVHRAVRQRAAHADGGLAVEAKDHALERPRGEQGVAVQQADIGRVGEQQPAVRRLHESEVHRVLEQGDAVLFAQPLGRPGVARVVDHDDPRPGRGEGARGAQTVARRPQRVVDRDDEVEPDGHLPRSFALSLHQRESVRQEVEA